MAERSFAKEVQKLKVGEGETFSGEGILALTKALLEAGVGYVGGYQGAPISHLMDVLADAEEIHLTIGLHPQTLHSLLIELVDLAAFEDIELRKTAPQELTPAELVGRLNKTVESLKGEVPTKKYSAGNTQANWPSLQISTGDLDKYRWADPGDTIVTAKKDRVRVSSPTRTIELLRELDSVLDRIICGDVFEVASLNHSHPKLLCHHLARNGFLIPISRS